MYIMLKMIMFWYSLKTWFYKRWVKNIYNIFNDEKKKNASKFYLSQNSFYYL